MPNARQNPQPALRRAWRVLAPLVIVICLPLAVQAGDAADEGPRVLKNPYADVNWEEVTVYRANFHSHTVLSDGRAEPAELIHAYADAGYHILALTDHDNGYTHREGERDVRQTYIHRGRQYRAPTSETTWPWTRWIDERPTKIWAHRGIESSAFYPELGESGMLAVRGAELSTHPHISSLFSRCGWPDRNQSDDERLACVEEHGGVSYWAHPTHYAPGGRWEDVVLEEPSWEAAVEYFGRYIAEHDSKLGFEVRTRGRLKRDMKLLDLLLARYYPEHDIFIKGSDDNHATTIRDDAPLTLVLAEDLTEEAVRHALTSGHKLVGSRTESYPQINGIVVDEDAHKIHLDIDNYEQVRWIKDGQAYTTGASLDYSSMADAVLRFEIDQDGATFYSQGLYIR